MKEKINKLITTPKQEQESGKLPNGKNFITLNFAEFVALRVKQTVKKVCGLVYKS